MRQRPLLMGILNVTPDSFSDGGQFFAPDRAIEHGLRMIEEGADILDIGGESTRPGAQPVSEAEELRRVLPVVNALAKSGARISIDTMKPRVARAAIAEGATIVNDVGGLRDPAIVEVCAETGCTVCIMHMRGEPRSMQVEPTYGNVVSEVRDYLLKQAVHAERGGVARSNIWIDPGFGFGKTLTQNLSLLRNLSVFVGAGYPVLVGVSRKSFIGTMLGSDDTPCPPRDRLFGTIAAQVLAQQQGASVLRVHDVKASRDAAVVAHSIFGPADSPQNY